MVSLQELNKVLLHREGGWTDRNGSRKMYLDILKHNLQQNKPKIQNILACGQLQLSMVKLGLPLHLGNCLVAAFHLQLQNTWICLHYGLLKTMENSPSLS